MFFFRLAKNKRPTSTKDTTFVSPTKRNVKQIKRKYSPYIYIYMYILLFQKTKKKVPNYERKIQNTAFFQFFFSRCVKQAKAQNIFLLKQKTKKMSLNMREKHGKNSPDVINNTKLPIYWYFHKKKIIPKNNYERKEGKRAHLFWNVDKKKGQKEKPNSSEIRMYVHCITCTCCRYRQPMPTSHPYDERRSPQISFSIYISAEL